MVHNPTEMNQAIQLIPISCNSLLAYWIINRKKRRYHSFLRLLSPRTVTWQEQLMKSDKPITKEKKPSVI